MLNHSTGKAEATPLVKSVTTAVLCVACPGRVQFIAYSSQVMSTKPFVWCSICHEKKNFITN